MDDPNAGVHKLRNFSNAEDTSKPLETPKAIVYQSKDLPDEKSSTNSSNETKVGSDETKEHSERTIGQKKL